MTMVSVLAFRKNGRVISKDSGRLTLDAIEVSMCMEDWNHQEEKLFQLQQI